MEEREPESTAISPSWEKQLPQPSRSLSLHWTNHLSQATGPGPPGDSPGPQDRLGSPGIQKQPPMCASSSPGQSPWEHQPEELGGDSLPTVSLLPPPPWHKKDQNPVQCTKQPLISSCSRRPREGGRGSPALRTHSPCSVRPLTREQSSSLPLCRLLHA